MKGKASTVALLLTVALCAVALFGFRLYQSRVSQAASEPAQQREGQNWQGQRGNQPQGGPGAGRGGPQYPQGGGGNFGSNQPPLVEAGTVTKGMITEQLWLVGSLKPKSQVEVLPKVTGKLQRILVDVGDMVREGQLIAELEGDELEQQVLRAEAALAVAEATLAQRNAELENARADGERAAQLAAEGLMSVQARQTAETRTRVVEAQLKTAEAQMRQAQADLAELKIRQQQTKITSPLTGWVGKRYVDPGALLGPNTPIVSVLQLSSLITEVRVPEQSLSKLRPGNRAVIYIDALAGRAFQGRVTRIAPVLDAATRSGSVQVEIPNPDGQLKAEMSARIQMDLGTQREAVLVPRDAVVIRGQVTGVHVLDHNRVHFQVIQTGISTDRGVEVLAGLSPGTAIITRGSQSLQDGALVEVQGASPGVSEKHS